MSLSTGAIRQPVTVAVGVILIILTGVVAIGRIPVQLTPNVEDTIISVTTRWEGASPQEVEQEIVDPQEEKLQGLANLRGMTSTSGQGQGQIRLEFNVGTDKDAALREVSDKLREVPEYPENVDEPVVEASDPENRDYIAWIVLSSTDPDFDVRTLQDFVEDRVEPVLERVPGVSEVNVLGGREREVQIRFDPEALAARGLTLAETVAAIQRTNLNVSAGELQDGKQSVRVRTVAQYETIESVENTVLRQLPSGPIQVRDVATVVLDYKEPISFVRSKGRSVIAINAQKEVDANVIEVMAGLQDALREIQVDGGILAAQTSALQNSGRMTADAQLKIEQVYDQTIYIDDALALVQNNIWLGGSLAILVLLLFLRSLTSAGIIALAIPISVMGAIVVMVALGRNVNIISLAGMAFAVGMVVDNAIVVLENIFRHLEMGKRPMEAARVGALEVWGAVLAATLTTVAVFIPILLIEDEAGQLFRDIALAICAAVTLSLLVSITVIPAAAARLLRPMKKRETPPPAWKRWIARITSPFSRFPDLVGRFIHWSCGSVIVRVVVVLILTIASLWGTRALVPPADYLPTGNRNLVFGIINPPSGYSLEQQRALAERVESTVRPYWEAGDLRDDPAAYEKAKEKLPSVNPMGREVTPPPLQNYFIVSFNGGMFHGGIVTEPEKVADLQPLFFAATNPAVMPGVIAFAFQVPLFRLGGRSGSAVKIDFAGDDLDAVSGAASAFMVRLIGQFGPRAVQPDPSNFNIPGPELQIDPIQVRLAQAGLTPNDIGLAVATRGDGAIIGEYRIGGETVDLKLISGESVDQQFVGDLRDLPLATPGGEVIPLNSVARLRSVATPTQIKRVGRKRAVTLELTPDSSIALEEAVAKVDSMLAESRAQGVIPPSVETSYSGSASKLESVQRTLLGDGTWLGALNSSMIQALVVVYLVMCVLFQSFLRPLVIMLSVPLATFGGFAALAAVHAWSVADPYLPEQKLDILTMLGFLILIGVVVNNAILIVHQSLNFMGVGTPLEGEESEPMAPREAIAEAVKSRVRPIFMGTMTSVGGMAPLVFMPGSGSELYRGLGSVVIGGLIVSTVFTLLLVPLLFSLVTDLGQLVQRFRLRRQSSAATVSAGALLLVATLGLTGCSVTPEQDVEGMYREMMIDARSENEPVAWSPKPPEPAGDNAIASRRSELESMAGPESYGDAQPDFGTDLTGSTPTARVVNLPGAILTALRNSLPIREGRIGPDLASEQLVVAEAEFDPLLFASFDFQKLDQPRAVSIINGILLGRPVDASESESLQAGVEFRSSQLGTTATISSWLDRFENDTPGFSRQPDPSYTARVGLELRQPLLKGYGPVANRAEIELAERENQRATHSLATRIADLVEAVEFAYWDLGIAHQTLKVQERLVERGREVRDVLSRRRGFDAEPAQLSDARAVVEQRQAELIRAQNLVQRASDRLKFLMNDPELQLSEELLLVPTALPEVAPPEIEWNRSLGRALSERPEIRNALLAVEDADTRARLAEQLLLPRLDLTAELSYSGLDDRWYRAYDEIDGEKFVSYAVGLIFELPFGNRRAKSERTIREYEREQSVLRLREAVREVTLEVKEAVRELKTSYRLIGATEATRLAETENLRALLVEERTLQALTPEFLNLKFQRQERLAVAEIAEIQARTRFAKAKAALARATADGLARRLTERLEEPPR